NHLSTRLTAPAMTEAMTSATRRQPFHQALAPHSQHAGGRSGRSRAGDPGVWQLSVMAPVSLVRRHMAKIGRNDPCPCASGKKYKRCCGDLSTPKAASIPANEPRWLIEDDGLDDVSNSVLHLVKARRFDEALAACKRLLTEFPEVNDGFDRSAIVHAALGNHALAADFFRKALAFAADPLRRADYDEELIEHWRHQAAEQERL